MQTNCPVQTKILDVFSHIWNLEWKKCVTKVMRLSGTKKEGRMRGRRGQYAG